MPISRRHMLTSALALGAMHAFPQLTLAQARRLVFATFTGSWEEAHKDVLVPHFRKANGNAEITLDPMLSVDAIAKVKAALANPPIDVMLHDPGPALVAIAQDLVEPFPIAASANYKDLIADAQEPMGPGALLPGRRPHLQPRQGEDAADLVVRHLEARVQGPRRHHQPQLDARHRLAGRDRAHARRLGGERRRRLQGDRGAQAQPRRRRRQSGRAGDALSAGPDRHRPRQLQRHPDPQGARRAGRVRGAEGGRDRLQDHHPHRQELAQQGAGRQADRVRAVAGGAGQADGAALPDRADQHQGEDGRRDRQGAGQGPRRHEEEVRVPGLEEDQRAARGSGSRSSTARSRSDATSCTVVIPALVAGIQRVRERRRSRMDGSRQQVPG